jgi:GNAT superfamily N-acetyltransferase
MELGLRPGVTADIPSMVEAFLSAFSTNPAVSRIFPATSSEVQASRREGFTAGFQNPDAHFLVVEDVSTSPPTFVAFAKWLEYHASSPYDPLPTNWPQDGDPEFAREFLGDLNRKHRQIMAERKHWFLDLLVARREFHGKGAGRMLLEWGCTKADEAGWEAYLDSTPDGFRLYEKLGFKVVQTVEWTDRLGGKEYVHRFMLRGKKELEV